MLFGSHVTGLATKARTCLVSAAEQLSPAATSSSPGLIYPARKHYPVYNNGHQQIKRQSLFAWHLNPVRPGLSLQLRVSVDQMSSETRPLSNPIWFRQHLICHMCLSAMKAPVKTLKTQTWVSQWTILRPIQPSIGCPSPASPLFWSNINYFSLHFIVSVPNQLNRRYHAMI